MNWRSSRSEAFTYLLFSRAPSLLFTLYEPWQDEIPELFYIPFQPHINTQDTQLDKKNSG